MTIPTTTVPTEPTEAMIWAGALAAMEAGTEFMPDDFWKERHLQAVERIRGGDYGDPDEQAKGLKVGSALYRAMLAAAPDPLPQGDLREAVEAIRARIATWDGHDASSVHVGVPVNDLRTVLDALLTPARSEWRPADVPPDISVGDERWYIVAVKRGHSGSIHSFGAAYLNGVEMYDEDDNSAMTMTGWYDTSNDDGRTLYNPVIGNEDELMGWQEFPLFQPLPEAPSVGVEP